MYKEISKCRVCSNTKLKTVINLGAQKLTGVFPLPGEFVDDGPLELVKCEGESGCGLVQLRHSCDTSQMYGLNYGYRSGLNQSMVEHLSNITSYIKRMVTFDTGDIVLDIGSNDGTLLGTYCFDENKNIHLCGMDPTAVKFKQYYKSGIEVIEDFFSANNFVSRFGTEKKAKVITIDKASTLVDNDKINIVLKSILSFLFSSSLSNASFIILNPMNESKTNATQWSTSSIKFRKEFPSKKPIIGIRA